MFDLQDYLDPSQRSVLEQSETGNRKTRRKYYRNNGILTKEVISKLQPKVEDTTVGIDAFLLSVGFCKSTGEKPNLQNDALNECNLCFYDRESKSIVCLWNGYNQNQIDELVDHCPALVGINYWKAEANSKPDHGRFGHLGGKSLHRPYLFYLRGPTLENRPVPKVSRFSLNIRDIH